MKRKTFIKKLRAFTTACHCWNKAHWSGGSIPKCCIFTGRGYTLPKGSSYQEVYDLVMNDYTVRFVKTLKAEGFMK